MKFLKSCKRPFEYDCDVDKLFRKLFLRMTLRILVLKSWQRIGLVLAWKKMLNHYLLEVIVSFFLFVVCIEDDDFKDLIVGCPRIQKLGVQDTEKLQTIVVSNSELQFFEVNLPCSDGKIRIESTNLDLLEFISFNMDLCEVEITSTTTKLVIDNCNILSETEINPKLTVRNLTMCNVSEEDTTWKTFIDKFLLLEKLIIADCKLQILHLSQPNLVSLVLKDCMVKYQVQVFSPKLKSLEFKGDVTNFEGIEDLQELEFILLYLDPVIIIPAYVIRMVPVIDSKHLELKIMSCHYITKEFLEDFI
ncbi:hypothetical protein H5410_011413 [Solanum commersonii]|uniref:Uncharacterized protein n=1 Tax=Solanum commersonii TaxID=4109 RepID=A0A9J6APK9_SOLCO|nr:hypothetical protein H5410_011413 [Solanum commersonii]